MVEVTEVGREVTSRRNISVARKVRRGKVELTHDQFRALLVEGLKPVMPAIIEKAATQALDGDDKARQWLTDRLYGKAPQSIEMSSTVEHHYSGGVNIAVLVAEAAKALKESKT